MAHGAVEATEIAEKIHEHHEHAPAATHDGFRRLAGIYVGVVAMLLAISTLGGAEASRELLNSNIHASDTYSFYQAKTIRQNLYQTSAAELETIVTSSPNMPAEQSAKTNEVIKRYRDTVARYESEPQTGDGKKELMAKAKEWEKKRDHAAEQIPNFEYSEALFQIAIVLGSVAIVASSVWLLGFSGILAICALLLTLNGYFLLIPLDFLGHH